MSCHWKTEALSGLSCFVFFFFFFFFLTSLAGSTILYLFKLVFHSSLSHKFTQNFCNQTQLPPAGSSHKPSFWLHSNPLHTYVQVAILFYDSRVSRVVWAWVVVDDVIRTLDRYKKLGSEDTIEKGIAIVKVGEVCPGTVEQYINWYSLLCISWCL